MRLLRSFPVLTFALVLLSIIGFCVAQRSAALLLVAGALAAMSWFITEGPRGRSLPRWVSNILLIAVILNFSVDYLQHHQPEEMMGVLGRFSVWLTLIKLYERKEPRDYAHLLALSLLLILTGCFQSGTMLFGLVLILYVALGLYLLVLYHLYAAYERARFERARSAPTDYRLVPALRPIVGRHILLHFRSLVLVATVLGWLLSGVLFVSLPREVGDGVFTTLGGPVAQHRAGYTDRLDVSSGSRITDSHRKVLTLRIENASGEPVRLEGPIYLRGTAFDDYRGDGRWARRAGAHLERFETEAGQPRALGSAARGGPDTYTLHFQWLWPHQTVFCMYVPVAVTTDMPRSMEYDAVHQVVRSIDTAPLLRYSVQADTAPSDATLQSLYLGPPSIHRELIDPEIHRRVAALEPLIESIQAEAGLERTPPADRWQWNRRMAQAFADHLHRNPFTYTLDLSDVVRQSQTDPVVQFLLQTHRGHCEFYASAMALLCRLAGVEARVINGYLAYQFVEEAQAYSVLESNAHAWVEVRTGRYRWDTFDPTPPLAIHEHHAVTPSLANRIRWMFDELESTWDGGIVSFDRRAQRQLGRSLDLGWSRRFSRALQATGEWMQAVNRAFYFGPAGYIWMGIVSLALVIAVIALIKLLRRTRLIRRSLRAEHLERAESHRMLRQLGFYIDMLLLLERGGCPKPAWQPPGHFAESIRRERPQVAAAVAELTDFFYRSRYGAEPLSRTRRTRARVLLEELARQLKVRR